ncbi:protein of unknown function [Burkholderia multivorans]
MPNTTLISDLDARHFRDEDVVIQIRPLVTQYAALRARAVPPIRAFMRAFKTGAPDQSTFEKAQALESTDLYNALFEKALAAVPVNELLDSKKALHKYMEVVNHPSSKDTAKISALKEAAVIAGITVIDENGKTRAGASLDDFYKALDEARAAGNATSGAANEAAPTKH